MLTNFVIFDCDGGSDDAWALLLLLQAETEKRVKILGITVCGCGNTDLTNAARNMLRILKACDRMDVPIYLGAADSLIPTPNIENTFKFHGEDGFGDILPEEADLRDINNFVASRHAVMTIYDLCRKYRRMVTLIAVGPLTNLALCYSMYGRDFAESVKEIFIMGGNHLGVGNQTRAAEFNFYSDPEAAHIVLSKSLCPITILPWEPCMRDRFFIEIEWRLEKLGKDAAAHHPAIEILNKVEYSQWIPRGVKGWNPCDAMLVAVFLFEKSFVLKESHWHATCDLNGFHTRGQMVLDHLHNTEKFPKNVRIIEHTNDEFFRKVAEWVAGLRKMPEEI